MEIRIIALWKSEQELEAELEEAHLQIFHLEKILGRAVGRTEKAETGPVGNGGSEGEKI